jgi:hypothetical protein
VSPGFPESFQVGSFISGQVEFNSINVSSVFLAHFNDYVTSAPKISKNLMFAQDFDDLSALKILYKCFN